MLTTLLFFLFTLFFMYNPEEEYKVIMTDEGVACEHPRRKREYIEWNNIDEVVIVTTDEGPFMPDVWLVLIGKEAGCSVPQGADGFNELYERVSKFENFNFDAVIKAMSCTDNAKFVCWERENTQKTL